MSKIKLIILVLGGLLIGNANVQAAKGPNTEPQNTQPGSSTVGEENPVSSETLEPAPERPGRTGGLSATFRGEVQDNGG